MVNKVIFYAGITIHLSCTRVLYTVGTCTCNPGRPHLAVHFYIDLVYRGILGNPCPVELDSMGGGGGAGGGAIGSQPGIDVCIEK